MKVVCLKFGKKSPSQVVSTFIIVPYIAQPARVWFLLGFAATSTMQLSKQYKQA